jgi:L-malate glycosyltransferase
MVIPRLATGGAEWAFIRLANALSDAQHQVTCYIPYRCDSERDMLSHFKREVRLFHLPLMSQWLNKAIYKISLRWPRFDLEQRIHSAALRLLHRLFQFHAINPHLRVSTRMCCHAFREDQLPIVETDHGDYRLLEQEDPKCLLPAHQLILNRVNLVICPSQSNLARVQRLPWPPATRFDVIPYAIELPGKTTEPRSSPFTFGMVARGVEEKGWEQAIQAFNELRKQTPLPVRFILVGDGPAIQRLRRVYGTDPDLEFVGNQTNPAPWIAQFHLGLLPSYFAAESLPCSIIECIAHGKPVIATDIGGIPEMLNTPDGPCGITIPLACDGKADVAALVQAMRQCLDSPEQVQRLASNTRLAVTRYLPATVAEKYSRHLVSEQPCL